MGPVKRDTRGVVGGLPVLAGNTLSWRTGSTVRCLGILKSKHGLGPTLGWVPEEAECVKVRGNTSQIIQADSEMVYSKDCTKGENSRNRSGVQPQGVERRKKRERASWAGRWLSGNPKVMAPLGPAS